jgi:uncharacterized repeat protein (TIGR01451 family)
MVPDETTSASFTFTSGASVEYVGDASNHQSSGTGLFDPFVRLQGSHSTAPTEKGYNTCSQSSCGGDVSEFDTKTGSWTKAIKASAIPIVDCDGAGSGTATCWELFNDINDGNSAKYISLTKVEIWFANNARITSYPFSAGGTFNQSKEYEFNGEIKMHDVNSGSGRGDLRYLVPVAGHPFNSSTYFVLYSEWGSLDPAPDGKNFASEGGFEEWKVRKAANVGILKTANPAGPVSAGTAIGFDIVVSNTGAAAASNVQVTDSLPAGGDLNWSLSPAYSGCAITGSVGAQTLNCTFATVAAGATLTAIHITSPTTKLDCAAIPNTASIVGDGTSSASVTVQCPAVTILKTANPAGPVSAGLDIGFDMTVSNAGPGNATNVTISDPLPAGTDLDWALNPSFTGCAITGLVGHETLNCSLGALASGGSIGPIHIQSATTQQDCAVVSNTATVASGNDGGNPSTATVSVECAAIAIVKNSTKGGAVLNAGAVFSYGTGLSVTDNSTGDEDPAIGAVCVSGLAPGNYTVNETTAPTGYGGAPGTEADQVVVAANGTNCTTSLPGSGATATFTNAPLYDLQVNFRDGGSGETSVTSMSCTGGGTSNTDPVTGWDSSNTYTGQSAPQTVTCTIIVDP